MKLMDFFVWLGARRRHSCSYGNDEQQRQAEMDALMYSFWWNALLGIPLTNYDAEQANYDAEQANYDAEQANYTTLASHITMVIVCVCLCKPKYCRL
jgi:hypothetical protein